MTSWVVPGGDWPAVGRSDDLTPEEVLEVLDQFDEYWEPALKSLENQS